MPEPMKWLRAKGGASSMEYASGEELWHVESITQRRVAADSDQDPCHTVIFDIRSGDYTAELRDGDDFVAALKRLETDFQGRFALVVPESLKVLAGLFCLLANVAGIDRIRPFTGIEQAIAWCSEPADVTAGPGGSAARERSV